MYAYTYIYKERDTEIMNLFALHYSISRQYYFNVLQYSVAKHETGQKVS